MHQLGVEGGSSSVMITNGAKDAISLCCRALMGGDSIIFVPSPTYLTAILIFLRSGARVVPIAQDDWGVCPETLAQMLAAHAQEPGRRFVYLIPEFDNPTGRSLSLERQKKIAELIQQYDAILIEDDPYRQIRFSGTPNPPISSFLPERCFIYIGTTSKILAPGLRFGWIMASPEAIACIARYKDDGCSCSLSQVVVAAAFESGYAAEFSRNLSMQLKEHRDELVAALREHFPESEFQEPSGGYFLWVKLPVGTNASELAIAAEAQGVSVFPGHLFYPTNPHPTNEIRLAFSNCAPEILTEGVKRLTRAYRNIRKE